MKTDTQQTSKQTTDLQIPEVYTNAALANISPYEFEITLGLASSNYDGVRPVVNLRMSPEFAKEFAGLLADNVKLYGERFSLPGA